MSRKNVVKIITNLSDSTSESSGYHFKSSSDDSSYVIGSKHGVCHISNQCEPYNDGVSDCCKQCNIKLCTSHITLNKHAHVKLTPQKIYGLQNKDIAIIQVQEKSYTPLRLGKLVENNGNFISFGYKAKQNTPLRLLLNAPEIDGSECYFNIQSNPHPELVEKSSDYNGISGSLVIGQESTDIPIAYSILTTNEEGNDLSGDILFDINFDDLNLFFNSRVFSEQPSKITLDTSFKNHFKQISTININSNISISILVPVDKGFPHFNLNPIARSLTSELGFVLGHADKALNSTVLTSSALKVLRDQKHKQPAYKLLSSRVVESVLNAPHIYSTYIDHSHYHHVHLLNDSEHGLEFIVSSFGGEGALIEKLNQSLNDMIQNITKYSFNSKLIAERSFLNMKYSHEECELLYKALFSEQNEFISNLAIMHCLNMQSCSLSNNNPVEETIKSIVQQAIDHIDDEILKSITFGLNVNLYVMPVNKSNEIADIMEGILE
ncbi:hypothetical protein [Aeromonas veronii]|uniref:hypothetical protein n=1 Tax=Aeromonas veronii TaxID=654 RepID=UPI001116FA5F|nr:hypothetical protein [Aeromonas veronii]